MLYNKITVEKARDLLLESITTMEKETVPLYKSIYRIAACDVFAPCELPICRQSAFDGYAVNGKDLKGACSLKIVSSTTGGGKIPEGILKPGKTIKVDTGEALPEKTAAVIPKEQVFHQGSQIYLSEGIELNSNIKMPGEDFKKGDILAKCNTPLSPGNVGSLAAFGYQKITVYRRPSVAIICLGFNVVFHHFTPERGQVRDSNGPMLASLIQMDGGKAAVLECVGCSTDNGLTNLLNDLPKTVDLIITVGGAASGEFDRAFELLDKSKVEMLYWGVQAKPGGHSGAGLKESVPIICLPGNPAACAVGYNLLVSPVLRKMQGLSSNPKRISALCVNEYNKKIKKRHFLRSRMYLDNDGTWKVRILPGQKSSMLRSLLDYNSLVDLQAGHAPLKEGDPVTVMPLYYYSDMLV